MQPLERAVPDRARSARAGGSSSCRMSMAATVGVVTGQSPRARRLSARPELGRRPTARPDRRRRPGTRRSGRAGTSRPVACRRRRRTVAAPRGRAGMRGVALGRVALVGVGQRVGVDLGLGPPHATGRLRAARSAAATRDRPASSGWASACRRRAAARCGSRSVGRRRRGRRRRSPPGARVRAARPRLGGRRSRGPRYWRDQSGLSARRAPSWL